MTGPFRGFPRINITIYNYHQVTLATNHISDMSETSSTYVHVSPKNSDTLTEESLTDTTGTTRLSIASESIASSDLQYGMHKNCVCSELVMIFICSLLPGLYRRWRPSVQTTCQCRQSLPCTHLGETNYTPSHGCLFKKMHMQDGKDPYNRTYPWTTISQYIE